MKIEYTLVCPEAAKNKDGVTLTTKFTYATYEEAAEHKRLCEEWAKTTGKKDKSYIEKKG